ncbi:unnamed protein product [Parnassius apollo]|uniref:(apollo) hypothetical protein n=1 Tax=Parnassius apollo TaxID=110799 RepID=A0A8S3YAU6_PARAO|nr:unnamed protein product [Parnassius apollo]
MDKISANTSRKRFYKTKICDADLNILSVDAYFGGISHDSFIWNQHPVKNHIISLLSSGENMYLLGETQDMLKVVYDNHQTPLKDIIISCSTQLVTL